MKMTSITAMKEPLLLDQRLQIGCSCALYGSILIYELQKRLSQHSPKKSADPGPNPAPAAAAMCPKCILGLCTNGLCWCGEVTFGLGARILSMVNSEAAPPPPLGVVTW